MKSYVHIAIICIIFFSCSSPSLNKKNEINISRELNSFYNESLFNVKIDAFSVADSLFINLIDLDSFRISYRDYHQDNFLYSYSFYELYDYFKGFNYVEFNLPYKGLNHNSIQWFTKSDIQHFHTLYSQNQHYANLSKYVKNNISPYTSMGIQKSLDSLKVGFSDIDFDSDFYELLSQYSFDCNKDIKESKYKKYMFIMTLLCKRGGEPFQKEYEALKHILNECDIDTNVLNKKEF